MIVKVAVWSPVSKIAETVAFSSSSIEKLHLSASRPRYCKTIKVAKTINDLEGGEQIKTNYVAKQLQSFFYEEG